VADGSGVVVAVCRVHALLPDRGNGVTGIDKRPVDGPVRAKRFGLFGDVQADRQHHGGEHQAVYAYAEEDVARFEADLGRELPPGLFGENLRTRGIDVTGAVIGERWRVGGALLEVTSPRNPCGTFERRMGIRGWVATFAAAGAPGAYFRVIRAGSLRAGDTIEVVDRPEHGVTVGRWFVHEDPVDAERLVTAAEIGRIRLHPGLREAVDRSLKKAAG
jgi:MOSC domain-containing protein YiiM